MVPVPVELNQADGCRWVAPTSHSGTSQRDVADLAATAFDTNDLAPYEVRLLYPSPHEQAEHSVSRLSLCAVVLTLSALRGASSQTDTELIFLSKFDILNDGTNGSRSEHRGGSTSRASSEHHEQPLKSSCDARSADERELRALAPHLRVNQH